VTATTTDLFLAGKIAIQQPAHGFRAGLDTVLLAAALPAREDDNLLEFGSGAGAGSLCVASRVPACRVTGVEIDPDLIALSTGNAVANGFGDRLRFVEGDILGGAGCMQQNFDHVFMNPPFYPPRGATSPDVAIARAKQDGGRLRDWIRAGLKRVRPGGTFTAILRADRLPEALAEMSDGGIAIFPVWPRADEPAHRVILRAVKGSRSSSALLPGLVVHGRGETFTPEADAVMRGGALLALSNRRR
jgi:tRNA1(Val) A37 N6-methylase TrmN6